MRWDKERDPLSQKEFLPPNKTKAGTLSLLGFFAITLTLLSFFIWDGSTGEGEVSRAAAEVRDFLEENEAISVFLGWDE